MLTKTANEMIGRRAKVKSGDYRDVEGTIDRVTLWRDTATVRLIANRSLRDVYVDVGEIDYCQCGEGDGCYLCAEKVAELPKHSAYGFPRRQCLYLMTPAELAIYNAVQVVEEVGADPLLTDAVVLLQQAREKVADYVDRTQAGEPERAENLVSVSPGTQLAEILSYLEPVDTIGLTASGFEQEANAIGKARVLLDGLLKAKESGRANVS